MVKNYKNKNSDLKFKQMLENPSFIPFSFIYGGKTVNGFDKDVFTYIDDSIETLGEKETHNLTFKLEDDIRVEVKLTHYYSHSVTEFTVFFENIGKENSKVIENPRFVYEFCGENPLLKGIQGDHHNYYMPYCFNFTDKVIEFNQTTGKPTEIFFPYYNLEYGNGGTMLAIGWGGTWSAKFERTEKGVLCCANSVNNFKAYLKPNEKIRTALYLMADYTVRDEDYATNYWRDWFLKYNTPKANLQGDDIEPFTTISLAGDTGKINSDGSISEGYDTWKPSYDVVIKEKIDADYRWVDAGWYVRPDGDSAKPFVDGYEWWNSLGT